MRGPTLENVLSSSCLVTLATANALSAAAGEETRSSSKQYRLAGWLPAATTNNVPYFFVIAFTASDFGSVPSVAQLPRLRFTTRAPLAAAHSIPAMMSESTPDPPSSSTLPTSSLASGATPL
jgi:hypothetical protein